MPGSKPGLKLKVMASNQDLKDDDYLMQLLAAGQTDELAFASQILDSFPHGTDHRCGQYWITHAVEQGAFASIVWLIAQGVSLDFVEPDGYTVIFSALDRTRPDKYAVLEYLLQHQAPLNLRGFNDWTPLHKAASMQDIRALQILLDYGADPQLRTRIDDYATPLEEAQNLGWQTASAFLAAYLKSNTTP